MTNLLLAVMGQARHVRAVHSFICELLMIAMPDFAKGNAYIRNSTQFCERIDRAIRDVSAPKATESEYARAIVDAACEEMAPLCSLLKAASGLAGLERIAAEYLDTKRFREMLFRRDSEKLERLVAIVKEREGKPIKILMDVAKELNDGAANYDEMNVAAKRKASADMKKVIAKVEEIRSTIDAHRDEVVSHVDAVGGKVDALNEKVSRLKLKAKRRSKYTDAQRNVCRTCWKAAQRNAELRYSANGSVTHEMAFNYHKRELAEAGVSTFKKFKAILHAVRSRECEDRKRELEAKREAERKGKTRKR